MIPSHEELMLPMLKLLSDGKMHSKAECTSKLSEEFQLSEDERRKMLPSGRVTIINSRVGWSKTYLQASGLVETGKRGYYKITNEGLKVLRESPTTIDSKFLMRYKSFRDFYRPQKKTTDFKHENNESKEDVLTPEEQIDKAYKSITSKLASDIIDKILQQKPQFFEKLVVDLLQTMGYGVGHTTQLSGDGGIDGIIQEDKLGLSNVFIQAKRWQRGHNVGRPELQAFVGAMASSGGKRGVFITTSDYSKEATSFKPEGYKIALINGTKLAELMISYNVGVSTEMKYEIKKIDSDYYEDNLSD